MPPGDAPNASQKEESGSQSPPISLISPLVLLGVGVVVIMAGLFLQMGNIVNLGAVTVILASGILLLVYRMSSE
jgi:hypothetical protein